MKCDWQKQRHAYSCQILISRNKVDNMDEMWLTETENIHIYQIPSFICKFECRDSNSQMFGCFNPTPVPRCSIHKLWQFACGFCLKELWSALPFNARCKYEKDKFRKSRNLRIQPSSISSVIGHNLVTSKGRKHIYHLIYVLRTQKVQHTFKHDKEFMMQWNSLHSF